MSYFDDNEDRIIYGHSRRSGYSAEGVTCKHCGEGGLKWVHTGERWRLLNSDGKFHVCKDDNVLDDFEVVE